MLITQIAATLVRESPKAILVHLTGSGRELWVPKSVGRIEKVIETRYCWQSQLPSEFRKPEATALVVPAWWWDKVK